jgi:hypothetical protein
MTYLEHRRVEIADEILGHDEVAIEQAKMTYLEHRRVEIADEILGQASISGVGRQSMNLPLEDS